MRHSPERGTRERILEVAEASLGEHGYYGTRLHDIARQVGIQKASLFHYFPSKEELYRSVLAEGFGHAEQTIVRVLETDGAPLDKIRALIGAYVDMVAAHPARTKLLLRQSLGDAPSGYHSAETERLLSRVTSFVADNQRARLLAPIDPLAVVLGVVGIVAFFFTSAPVVIPAWIGDPWGPAGVERVKRHVIDVVERCLTVTRAAYDANDGASAQAVAAQPAR